MPSAGHVSPTSSLSSFSIVSHSRSLSFDDEDDDEIVFVPHRRGTQIDWSSADEDYILLSPALSARALSPRMEHASLAASMAALALNVSPPAYDEEVISATPTASAHPVAGPTSARQAPSPRQATPQPSKAQPTSQSTKATGSGKPRRKRRGASLASEPDETNTYQGAVNFVSQVLSDPEVATTQKLPFLQALLVELGICKPAVPLPGSIHAARALLKAKAHINIRDYIAARGQGLDALRAVMFPSRAKLIKDLRKRRVPVQWVKDHGLSVFLLSM